MFNNNYIKIINNLSFKKGLTLVELMVVISIFLIITSVAIFNYGNFNSTVSLQNLTDDIALSIRKAQSFAIGARGVDKTFNNSYGMHFSVDTNPVGSLSGSNKSFLMFAIPISVGVEKKYVNDGGINEVCNDGTINNECIELFNINTVDEIKEINIDGVTETTGSLDIVFTRPEPKASFCYRASSSNTGPCDSTNISRIDIIVSNGETADQYKTKTISIQNTGQISIQ